MFSENKIQIDSHKSFLEFDHYRRTLDEDFGLMRQGINNTELYQRCLSDEGTPFGYLKIGGGLVPLGVSNDLIEEVEADSYLGNRLFATLPSYYYHELDTEKPLVMKEVLKLSHETTEKIFSGDGSFQEDISNEIENLARSENLRTHGDSLNEYMFMTKYDMRPMHERFSVPAGDFETPNGFIVSTRAEEIAKYTPEIVKLQSDVFNAQAIQTGYFAGLSDEDTLSVINNPEFIPIIARDKNTNEIAMCTLFAPDFTDFDSMSWLNPNEVARHLVSGDVADCLTLPLIVISKTSGLGLLKYAVQMAMHETVYRKRPDTVAVMYESNPMSIYVTPRTIHNQIIRAGGECLYKHAEVYFFSEADTSTNS